MLDFDRTLPPKARLYKRSDELRAASRIVTSASWGYIALLHNWAHYVHRLGFRDFTVIAEDAATVRYLRGDRRYSHVIDGPSEVFHLADRLQDDHNSSTDYDTPSFLKIVGRRAAYLQFLLSRWRFVLYSDADIVWLRDPFLHLAGDADLEVSVDKVDHNGMQPYFCAGFMFIQNTSQSFHILTDWSNSLASRMQLSQPALNFVLHEHLQTARSMVRALDMRMFTSGLDFFFGGLGDLCRGQAVTCHVNWVVGVGEKRRRLQLAGLWFGKDVPCWPPEVALVTDDGAVRCLVDDISCVPRFEHRSRLVPIVFDAYVAADGVVLDQNGRLYGGGRLDSGPSRDRRGPRVMFTALPWLPGSSGSLSEDPSGWLSELCVAEESQGGLATLTTYAATSYTDASNPLGAASAYLCISDFKALDAVADSSWFASRLVLLLSEDSADDFRTSAIKHGTHDCGGPEN